MEFKFRLGTLLTLREKQRDDAQRNVARAQEALRIIEQRILSKDQEIADSKQALAEDLTGVVAIDTLLAKSRYELALQSDKHELQQQCQQIEDELAKRRAALVKANQAFKQLELLRDQARDEHRVEQGRRAQRELDEAAIRRFNRFGDSHSQE